MRKPLDETLAAFVPVTAVEHVAKLLQTHRIQLRVARTRLTKLGDFRPGKQGSAHQISVNQGLNVFEFLLVFLHELAHLKVHEETAPPRLPHGLEWRRHYGELIRDFVAGGHFHPSLEEVLIQYSYQVSASGVGNMELAKLLRAFDRAPLDRPWLFLDEVAQQGVFQTPSGRLFRKEEKLRKRYRCLCLKSRRSYLVHAMARVEEVVGSR